MSIGLFQIIMVIVLLLVLFRRERITRILKDVAKGLKAFKKSTGLGPQENNPSHTAEQPLTPKIITGSARVITPEDKMKNKN